MTTIDLGALLLQHLLMIQYQAREYPLFVLFQVSNQGAIPLVERRSADTDRRSADTDRRTPDM